MWASYSAQRERRLGSRISQQSHCLFGCRLVRRDRRDTLERRHGPKSLCIHIAPRSWFLIRAHPWTSGSIPLHRRYLGYGWHFFSHGFSFSNQIIVQGFGPWTGPKPFLRASRRGKIWISLERVWHVIQLHYNGRFWKSVHFKQCWLSVLMLYRTNQRKKFLLSWTHKFESGFRKSSSLID